MTDKVLHYLKHDRSFATGLGMYQNMPGANRATVAHLSRTGSSKNNLEQLHYDMAKLAGINPQLYNRVMAQPVTPAPAQEQEAAAPAPEAAVPASNPEPINMLDIHSIKWPAHRALAVELGIQVSGTKKADYEAAFEAYNASLEEKKS